MDVLIDAQGGEKLRRTFAGAVAGAGFTTVLYFDATREGLEASAVTQGIEVVVPHKSFEDSLTLTKASYIDLTRHGVQDLRGRYEAGEADIFAVPEQ
mgnify:CR=1 FL=1